jgi:5-methylcytosine-specific restriction endonuclease McrA
MPIDERVKRLLLCRSGGYCQNPGCNAYIFALFKDGSITSIEQLAHVIAKAPNGPRGHSAGPLSQKDEYENLIVLCPNCHTLVDKAPKQYPVATLMRWKRDHEARLDSLFNVPTCESRYQLSLYVHDRLRRNKAIFDTYGPQSSAADKPISDAAQAWKVNVLETIIPNNRSVRLALEKNLHLLSDSEKDVFQKFVLHQEAFEYNHLTGDKNSTAPLFPLEMNSLLTKE